MLRSDSPSEQGDEIESGEPFPSWFAASARSGAAPGHLIIDELRLGGILEGLASERARGLLRGASHGAPVNVRLVEASEEELSLRCNEALSPGQTVGVRFEGQYFAYDLEAEVRSSDGEHVQLSRPARILRSPGRHERRIGAPHGLSISFRHPRDPRLWVNRPVLELSRSGLSFSADAFRDGLTPGQRLEDAAVIWDEGDIHLSGTLAHVSKHAGKGERAGLQVDESASKDAEKWQRAIARWLYVHTRLGQTWADASWSLYDRSGYFRLSQKAPAHFAHLRRAFAVASRRLDLAPELGAQITWPSARGIEASLSLLRVYAHTALLYQVARRKDDASPAGARTMLRAINLHAVEQLAADPTQRWLLVYVQDDGARWSRLAYRDFARGLGQTEASCVLPFHALELASTRRAPSPPSGVRLHPPDAASRALLLDHLGRFRPTPYLEALDLTPDRLELRQVRTLWRAQRFQREREILIASVLGRPVAASVMETADEGLHLFGLLDCMRLYPLIPGGESQFGVLIEAARAWFRSQGKERFVLLAEEDQAPLIHRRGVRNLGGASFIAFSRALFPEFLEHLHLITAHPPSEAAGAPHV